jgi:putative ABC transport system ATP-binding protein
MLKVTGLTKSFNSAGHKVSAVDDINLVVGAGDFVSVIGRSGSGKSTLLSLLGALDKPTKGSIEVDGQDITKLHDHALIHYRANSIGFVFQSYNLVPNLSAIENVMLAMEFAGMPKAEREPRARQLLEQVGLDETKQQRRPARLSGGEQQRVAIARALANRPKLILADEPTGNLDSQNGKLIFDLLHHLAKKEKTTIIVVTHDLSIAGKTDRTFELLDGKISTGRKR